MSLAAGDGHMMAVSGGVYANYVVWRNGQRFLLPVRPALEDAAQITFVVNWTSLVGRERERGASA